MTLSYTYHDSPIGRLLLAGTDTNLCVLSFPSGSRAQDPEENWQENKAPFSETSRQLDDYFDGKRLDFDLPLLPHGTTFQQSVWEQLVAIPYGETISYGELATRIGNRNASRAVGAANGANPIAVIIPCHRVIGADRSMTGFGGGVDLKRRLLNHELEYAPHTGDQGRLF